MAKTDVEDLAAQMYSMKAQLRDIVSEMVKHQWGFTPGARVAVRGAEPAIYGHIVGLEPKQAWVRVDGGGLPTAYPYFYLDAIAGIVTEAA